MSTATLTPQQLRAIHTLRRNLYDEETYRDVLRERYGARSTKDLSVSQAADLLDLMAGRPQQNPLPEAGASEHPRRATRKQITFLRVLCGQTGWNADDWMRRVTMRPELLRLEQMTAAECSKCIVAAQRMLNELRKREQA